MVCKAKEHVDVELLYHAHDLILPCSSVYAKMGSTLGMPSTVENMCFRWKRAKVPNSEILKHHKHPKNITTFPGPLTSR